MYIYEYICVVKWAGANHMIQTDVCRLIKQYLKIVTEWNVYGTKTKHIQYIHKIVIT